jgi:hypothetical protein
LLNFFWGCESPAFSSVGFSYIVTTITTSVSLTSYNVHVHSFRKYS